MNENLTRHKLKTVTLSQGMIFCVTHPWMERKYPFTAQPPGFAYFFALRDITRRRIVIPYQRYGTERLSRNVITELPLYAV